MPILSTIFLALRCVQILKTLDSITDKYDESDRA